MHSAAQPFEDSNIDWCEFLSLVATLFICMSGLVFKLLNDPANPQQTEEAEGLSDTLELLSICLMLGTCVLALIVEVQVYRNVTDDSADYKVKMLTQQLEAIKADWESTESLLAEAEEKARVAEGHKNTPGYPKETEFDNPVASDDADDTEEDKEAQAGMASTKKGSKK